MNPRRPHPYQICDSTYRVAQEADQWLVLEDYTVIDRGREKDDISRPVAWFDTEKAAIADRNRRSS